ncbi:type II CRISPR-associated endonuclease Cas1 [uncultured Ligilactobacillus sp.]|uniref:type II CRISPR-associated endonuclease Cas1 n=1 Tax=uncultured Ligilactobacillus sp. TaxID=2837633 RepID=UPI00272CA908|nr:type II CRISPR-associated endonuclease Cas1 [uncultured Ligilactobacillus sp.]
MAKFNIYITRSSKIILSGQSIVIQTKDDIHTFPFSNIQAIMIENTKCSLSIPVINALAKAKINVWICDNKHLPSSMLMPVNQYYQTPMKIQAQIDLSSQPKKRIWEKIIKNKITNQATILEVAGASEAKMLRRYSARKTENIAALEAWTAKAYFKALFGPDFNRRNNSTINSALNYGYALVRSSIAKSLVCLGLQPALGIFHAGQKNNFNLADDLIEPFRPLVDYFVWLRKDQFTEELTRDDKEYLFSLLGFVVVNENEDLLALIENYVNSFSNFLKTQKTKDLLNIQINQENLQGVKQWKNY